MQKEELEQRIQQEKERRAVWKEENARRRHNYIGLILELLKLSAKKGALDSLYHDAANKKEKKIAAEKATKDVEMK